MTDKRAIATVFAGFTAEATRRPNTATATEKTSSGAYAHEYSAPNANAPQPTNAERANTNNNRFLLLPFTRLPVCNRSLKISADVPIAIGKDTMMLQDVLIASLIWAALATMAWKHAVRIYVRQQTSPVLNRTTEQSRNAA
jgi:hypothetical protein